MAEIQHYLIVDASAAAVYEAVTTQAGLAAWWTVQTVARPEVGAVIEFRFGERYHNRMKVTGLEQNRRVEWQCLEGGQQWVGTTFVFDLEAKEGQTVLRFTHGNWREATDFYASCNYHWGYYLRSLKLHCETGAGHPFTGD
jgi:uncharacterized protein YndB with AHSA1/START domain